MLSNMFGERNYLLGEVCALECGGNSSRVRKADARLEVRIQLHVRRPRPLIHIGEFLLEPKRDLAEGAQRSSFYPEQKILALLPELR